jgi:hypothetical protein
VNKQKTVVEHGSGSLAALSKFLFVRRSRVSGARRSGQK